LINDDCYGKGWMYKIKPENKGDLDNLMHTPEELDKWLAEEIEKYVKE
jgi:glycine cleavage system H protein